jgi:hypothetical protein
VVVKAAEFRHLDHPTLVWRMHRPRIRSIVVIVQISSNDALELALVQSDDMIETVAAQGSDEPLHKRVLPRTSWCAKKLLNPYAAKPLSKCFSVHRIAISKEILWRAVPWEGFDDLLGRPLSSRILGNVEVQDFPSRMCKYYQDEEELEPNRRYDEEIDRHKIMDMIPQERLPCRRGRLAGSDTVLIHRRFRHLDAELPQLAHNARRAPQRIRAGDLPDELADLLADRRPAGLSQLGSCAPSDHESVFAAK